MPVVRSVWSVVLGVLIFAVTLPVIVLAAVIACIALLRARRTRRQLDQRRDFATAA